MELSELFARSAREVLPQARAKKLVSYFDYRGPFVDLPDGQPALRAGIHGILLGAIECLDTGFVMFTAEAGLPVEGISKLVINAAATGVVSPDGVECVSTRLQLAPQPAGALTFGRTASVAGGSCPATGGKVTLVDASAEGLLISLELSLPAVVVPGSDPLPEASGVGAWLVSAIPGGLDSVGRRLRRLGWKVRTWGSLEQATSAMADHDFEDGTPPMLFIVAESTGDEIPVIESIALGQPALWAVLAVVEGSPTLQGRNATRVDIRALPLSPMEVERFTSHVDARTSNRESRETAPAPLYFQDRRSILVVDDNAINQFLADGLLDVLGFDVRMADNGAESLDACRLDPPDLVLMDIDMPVMDGIEATRQLRSMQAARLLPPFPIVAATSGDDPSRKAKCFDAGMNGFLNKPLELALLADELHRVLPARPAGTG